MELERAGHVWVYEPLLDWGHIPSNPRLCPKPWAQPRPSAGHGWARWAQRTELGLGTARMADAKANTPAAVEASKKSNQYAKGTFWQAAT